jgi:hypothetical protein
VPHGAKKLRTFTELDNVLRELPDIQVQRNQVVDFVDFAGGQLFLDAAIPLVTVNGLTPNLS